MCAEMQKRKNEKQARARETGAHGNTCAGCTNGSSDAGASSGVMWALRSAEDTADDFYSILGHYTHEVHHQV